MRDTGNAMRGAHPASRIPLPVPHELRGFDHIPQRGERFVPPPRFQPAVGIHPDLRVIEDAGHALERAPDFRCRRHAGRVDVVDARADFVGIFVVLESLQQLGAGARVCRGGSSSFVGLSLLRRVRPGRRQFRAARRRAAHLFVPDRTGGVWDNSRRRLEKPVDHRMGDSRDCQHSRIVGIVQNGFADGSGNCCRLGTAVGGRRRNQRGPTDVIGAGPPMSAPIEISVGGLRLELNCG